MKTLRLSLALIVASLAFANLVRAEDKDHEHPAGKQAKCCAAAAKDGKACTHECCAEAAKDGKNCEKCGGKNAPKNEHAM